MKKVLIMLMAGLLLTTAAFAQSKNDEADLELSFKVGVFTFPQGLTLESVKVNNVKDRNLARLLVNLYLHKLRGFDSDLWFDENTEKIQNDTSGGSFSFGFKDLEDHAHELDQELVAEIQSNLVAAESNWLASFKGKPKEKSDAAEAYEDHMNKVDEAIEKLEELGYVGFDWSPISDYSLDTKKFVWNVNNLRYIFPNGEIPKIEDDFDVDVKITFAPFGSGSDGGYGPVAVNSDEDSTEWHSEGYNTAKKDIMLYEHVWNTSLKELTEGKKFIAHFGQPEGKTEYDDPGDDPLFRLYFTVSRHGVLKLDKMAIPTDIAKKGYNHIVGKAAAQLYMYKLTGVDGSLEFAEANPEKAAEEKDFLTLVNTSSESASSWDMIMSNNVTSDRAEFYMKKLPNLFRPNQSNKIKSMFGSESIEVNIAFEEETDHAANTGVPKIDDRGYEVYTWSVKFDYLYEATTNEPYVFRTYYGESAEFAPAEEKKELAPAPEVKTGNKQVTKRIIPTMRKLLMQGKVKTAKNFIDEYDLSTASKAGEDEGALYHFKGVTYYIYSRVYSVNYLGKAGSYFELANARTKDDYYEAYSALWNGMLREELGQSKGEFEEGIDWLDKVIKEYSRSVFINDAKLYKAVLYYKLGKKSEAKELLASVKRGGGSVYSRWHNAFRNAASTANYVDSKIMK